jgi:protein TonB
MRLFLGLLLAVLVNWGLFSLMQSMATPDNTDLVRVEEINVLDFVRLKEQTTTELKQRELPDKPPPPKQPPPPPESVSTQTKPMVNTPNLNVPRIEMPLNIAGGPYIGEFSSAPIAPVAKPQQYASVMPLVRIPPRYPRSAARRNIEGKVKVAFTITKEGNVRDPEILESIPAGVFDNAAISAIIKWKFNPKVVDGQAVEQTAAQEIEFKLPKR